MLPELGLLALILAFALAGAQAALPLWGAQQDRPRLVALARPLAGAQSLFVTLSFAALVQAFVRNDFSVAYVAAHANSLLPLPYRVAGTWAGHEGSLLLWVEILGLWTLAVALLSRALPEATVARVLGVMGIISTGFLGFILFTSNPFARSLPAPADGLDLNPLLQDPGMVAHPPLLYMGYVGFAVAFAFAIAELIEATPGRERPPFSWTRWARPWTLAAWSFLTAGILLGSFWAYYELGWGGWWFWDAVENASFMPWLVGTALIHSLAVTGTRGSFRNWTVLLAILAFSLSLLGTFLVRSGVLSSVHAFASDPRRGLWILVFLSAVVGGSLTLYGWRAAAVGLGSRFALVSRESALLVNNVLLAAAAGTVLLGTLYPLVLDALDLGRISVGPPYFETVIVPLMLPLMLLLGVGPWLRWKQSPPQEAWRQLRWLALGAVTVATLAAVALQLSVGVALGLGASAWVISATLAHLWRQLSPPGSRGLRRLPGSQWGMVLAHLGLGVFAIGVTLVKGLETAHDLSLRPGDTARAGAYSVTFTDAQQRRGPNYIAAQARLELTREGQASPLVLRPEKRLYTVRQVPMTEAAIDRGLLRDVYVSLGEVTPDRRWIVRVQVKPFVGWIWAGAVLIALGGAAAAADRRHRRKAPEPQADSRTAGALPRPLQPA